MVAPAVEQQLHGYRSGHQLLAATATLNQPDQDLVDRLSDLSGPLAPNQEFEPYITTYPLPSGTFYVVARTWQDKAATRAGCVLTRSLLVPMQYWEQIPSLSFLLRILRPFDQVNANVSPVTIVQDDTLLPPVSDARTGELVEALFLESRQPIVMFDVPAADSIIARLLTALWPSMRRQFATCGFALGPRSLEGRSFDFLCAPKSSRSRFSDWPGRKVDEGASRGSRHRWTNPAVEQIFHSSKPNLTSFDTLGILKSDVRSDGGTLRIALLWNELQEKAKTSPNAALALLDILASQNAFAATRAVLPILSKSVELSRRDNTSFDHLRFVSTMLGKFFGRPMPLSLLRVIRASAASISRQDTGQAFEFLASAEGIGSRLPRIFCAGMADGFAEADMDSLSAFAKLGAETQLKLISSSERLDQRIVRSLLDEQATAWAPVVRLALEFPDATLRLRAAGRLIPLLSHKNHRPILQGVLSGAAWPAISRVITQLWRGCELKVPEFDDSILVAVVHAQAMANLRKQVCELPETPATDRLLTKAFQLDEADLEWLVASEVIGSLRKTRILFARIMDAGDYELGRVFANSRLKGAALQLLSSSGGIDSSAVARILVATGIASHAEFELGLAMLDRVDGYLRQMLVRLLSKGLFANFAWSGGQSASRLLGSFGAELDAREVIADATDQAVSAAQLNFNIGALNAAPKPLRTSVLEHVDQLSERIINFRRSFFDARSTDSWARLIADAGGVNRRTQLRAAEMVLPFALKMKHGPASPLIVVTFPLVHAELARSSAAPTLLSLFLGDYWDRCDALRRELIDAFMRSEWPAADLLVAAHAGQVAHEVLDLLVSRYGGREYQNRVFQDINRLSDDQQRVLRSLMEGRQWR